MFTLLLHKRPKFFLICILLSFTFFSKQVVAEPVTHFPENARIVSIGGSLTEIVYALGAQDQLVARDSTSVYPQEALKLPVLGYMRALSPEGVLSLAPEGILLVEGSGPASTIDILKKTSIPIVIIPENYSRESVIEKIRLVGKALHREMQAATLIEKINRAFVDNDALLAKVTKPKRVLFVLSVQNGRIMASGTGTAADGMIKLSGGINAITGYKGYKLLNSEALLKANPDVILLVKHGENSTNIDKILALPAIQATTAAKNQAIKQMDAMYLLGFGPRTANASKELIDMLYGVGQNGKS
ncbi:hemin ABC transporter substrate-binding protein [Bartonella henselae]|uniref:Hemin ABC transporter, periplasmic hemin-binding protein n=1 Tax=Bartonella henselae TaxID=38323 RepID=X5MGN1_BARHN|nr:ABC transporter substrate-binding protein [Bartonella henselae]MDM9996371.1 ABC transporter substrate-binding protein [Bartonella henselae]OLL48450.1 hemin ABC transporter substrate-binding protein [Bartonella henselae]OLL48778.1 hemin ABC transporter substrate-binding protein [Bartonella henselae]OLL49871.1 hemin ABC transporter substrate-binding protein [Bartonella henselae]OLL57425.1 hemin ABC transporter substrate-binding protein [Bartonella henselae]